MNKPTNPELKKIIKHSIEQAIQDSRYIIEEWIRPGDQLIEPVELDNLVSDVLGELQAELEAPRVPASWDF